MIDPKGIALVKEYEGLRLSAYKCPAGVWTIGWGHTGSVAPGQRISEAEAEVMLRSDLDIFEEGVKAAMRLPANRLQLAALTSLAFNIGLANFKKSTVLKAHNDGHTAAAGRAFALWNKARVNGVLTELPGLVSRRAREAALYLEAADEACRTPMPQEVAPEPRVATSPTIVASTVAAGAGGLATITDTVHQVSDLSYALGPLLRYGPIGLGVLAFGAIVYIVYVRFIRRSDGWR